MNISQSNTEKQIILLVNLGVEFKAEVCVCVCVRKLVLTRIACVNSSTSITNRLVVVQGPVGWVEFGLIRFPERYCWIVLKLEVTLVRLKGGFVTFLPLSKKTKRPHPLSLSLSLPCKVQVESACSSSSSSSSWGKDKWGPALFKCIQPERAKLISPALI